MIRATKGAAYTPSILRSVSEQDENTRHRPTGKGKGLVQIGRREVPLAGRKAPMAAVWKTNPISSKISPDFCSLFFCRKR